MQFAYNNSLNTMIQVPYLTNFVVPPPHTYNTGNSIYQSVDDFFFFYEIYAARYYGPNKYAWLQILPDFLTGDVKEVVTRCGLGIHVYYDEVKRQVIGEVKQAVGLKRWHDNFQLLQRDANESVTNFMLRLEDKVASGPELSEPVKHELVRAKFLWALEDSVANELREYITKSENTTNEELLHLAQKCEERIAAGNKGANAPTAVRVAAPSQPKERKQPPLRENMSAPNKRKITTSTGAGKNDGEADQRPWRNQRCWICKSRWHLRVGCPLKRRPRPKFNVRLTGGNPVKVCQKGRSPVRPRPNQAFESESVLSVGDAKEVELPPNSSTPKRGVIKGGNFSVDSESNELGETGAAESTDDHADISGLEIMFREGNPLDWSYRELEAPNFKDYLHILPLECDDGEEVSSGLGPNKPVMACTHGGCFSMFQPICSY